MQLLQDRLSIYEKTPLTYEQKKEVLTNYLKEILAAENE